MYHHRWVHHSIDLTKKISSPSISNNLPRHPVDNTPVTDESSCEASCNLWRCRGYKFDGQTCMRYYKRNLLGRCSYGKATIYLWSVQFSCVQIYVKFIEFQDIVQFTIHQNQISFQQFDYIRKFELTKDSNLYVVLTPKPWWQWMERPIMRLTLQFRMCCKFI